MSARVADNLAIDAMGASDLDAIIAATGLTGRETSLELAKMHIEAHAIRIRCEAEKWGREAAIALWNASFAGENGLDATLCGLIDAEPGARRREALTELVIAYEEAMRAELESDEEEEEMKDQQREALATRVVEYGDVYDGGEIAGDAN